MQRILIVEDDETLAAALAEYFRSQDHEVEWAQEVEEAKALVTYRDYAVAVVDLGLASFGGMDGLELIAFIHERQPQTCVLALTGYRDDAIRQEALNRGAVAFFSKPVPLAVVARAAAPWLEVAI